MLDSSCGFMMHYVNLLNTYPHKNDIKEHFQNQLLAEVKETAETSENYKYFIYRQFNPELKALSTTHRNLSRLRLSSHNMPIETGRWSRTIRENRLCQTCKVVGDEPHYIYNCCEIDRTGLEDIPSLDNLPNYKKLHLLMERLEKYLM